MSGKKEIDVHYTQSQLQALCFPKLKDHGRLYQKSLNIYARPSRKGEVIETVTADGKETTNRVTDEDSFVVKNQTGAGEEYIVKGEKFRERYRYLRQAEGAYQEYTPVGKIVALRMTPELWRELQLPDRVCYFEAPWGEAMKLSVGDYLVAPPDRSEVYRIAAKEFGETYRPV